MINFVDFYITDINDPNYTANKIIEDDIINVIIQKYKMIIFSNQGDVMGDFNFGCNLEELLFNTMVSETYVKNQIITQINDYIPELVGMNYTLSVVFTQDTYNFQQIMWLYFQIQDTAVYASFGKSIT